MKLKNLMNRIPRPVKAIFCAVCVVLLAICYYIALGCPTFTFTQEFRRAEKVHLVGPSQIVDTMDSEYSEFDKMIVGETEHGISFFGRYYDHYPYNALFDEKLYLLTYVKKTGDMTISAAPNIWGRRWSFTGFERSLPVYLFVDGKDAVRAEVGITVAGGGGDSVYEDGKTVESRFERTFQAEATRSDTSFFLFWFTADDQAGLSALSSLSNATSGNPYSATNAEECTISATVRLYDESENLILERELSI